MSPHLSLQLLKSEKNYLFPASRMGKAWADLIACAPG